MTTQEQPFRRTSQYLMPLDHQAPEGPVYDIYPAHDVAAGSVQSGFEQLAERLAGEDRVILDGYVGIDWEDFRRRLQRAFAARGVEAAWTRVEEAMHTADHIEERLRPFLGGDDPLFGTRYTGDLRDFFDRQKLEPLQAPSAHSPHVLYGCGAALAGGEGCLVYVDLPKNELLFRSRAGRVRNLGAREPLPPKPQYKRFYFVDWVVLNRHKRDILPHVDVLVDGQRPDTPAFIEGDAWRGALGALAQSSFRVRPWFEPGPWGGQWIRENIPGLSAEVPNYAWSFELIVPENGLLFRDGTRLLECSFDWLMYAAHEEVLGDAAGRFGHEFPIRFDFLDTIRGGNLSLQCHPSTEYIREHFGESFTQDETYYMMECDPGALVYLGFQDGIDPEEFHQALRHSHDGAEALDVDRHVQSFAANRHDLYLIPNGTIHCSGTGCLVLEISATPYIFTFKMYDWMRMDLDGNPRPLNIDRAMENLRFERSGERVAEELISRPRTLRELPNGRLLHLPTHADHFYDIHRFEFNGVVEEHTDGSVHVLSLVEGRSVLLRTPDGTVRRFHYAETFCVPAAAGSYRLETEEAEPVKVVKAFVKPALLYRP